MYTYLQHFLEDAFIYPRGGAEIPGNRFGEIYPKALTTGMKEQIIEAFQKFATVAFGMGLDIPDIEQIIHVGPSADIVQEIGCAGRSCSIKGHFYCKKQSTCKSGNEIMCAIQQSVGDCTSTKNSYKEKRPSAINLCAHVVMCVLRHVPVVHAMTLFSKLIFFIDHAVCT